MIFYQFNQVFQRIGLWNPTQVDAIFKIDKGIANIICCFDQKGKWMAMKGVCSVLQSQIASDFGKESRLCLKKSKFFITHFLSGLDRNGCFWVFGKGTKCHVAEAKTTWNTPSIFSQYPKAIGIAFKTNQVLLLCFSKGTDQFCTCARSKKIADGLFARMPKRRVANVVCQTSSSNNSPKIMWLIAMGDPQGRVLLDHSMSHCSSQTPTNNRYF